MLLSEWKGTVSTSAAAMEDLPPVQRKLDLAKLNKYALNRKKVSLWKLPDKDLRDLFIKFVGFVGYYNTEINPVDGLGYAIFDTKGEIHKGESNPEPIDDITGDYIGIVSYQADAIIDYRDNVNLLTIWSRGFGKSWVREWIIEISMKYEADKFLYFSLTDAAYRASNEVYIWGQNNNAIVDSETVKVAKKISGRRSSYQKFTLINGAQFEVHGIMTSSTLGYHGWIIIFDDIIDKLHQKLPHIQKRLEARWNSQYSKIRRKKLCIDNTRKYPGDFFDYIINQFETKQEAFIRKKGTISNKYTLFISHKTPYEEFQYKGDIINYRKFFKDFEKGLIVFDTNKIIAPWFEPSDFEIMRLENLSSFNSEILGIPQELEGGMIKPGDILYAKRPHFSELVQMGGTGIDPADTEDENNDYCAVVSMVMHEEVIEKEIHKRFTTYKSNVERTLARNHVVESDANTPYDWIDDNGNRIKRGLIEIIQDHCEYFRLQYSNKTYIVALERNRSGIAYIEQALHMLRNHEKVEIRKGVWVRTTWPKYLVEDPNQAKKFKKGSKNNVRLGVTHDQEKKTRIYGELKYSIENHEHRFTFDQEESLLIGQLKVYPNGKHDDGPDADGMIKDELDKRWNNPKEGRRSREDKLQEKRLSRISDAHKRAGQPWMSNMNEKRKYSNSSNRRGKFK